MTGYYLSIVYPSIVQLAQLTPNEQLSWTVYSLLLLQTLAALALPRAQLDYSLLTKC